MESTVRTDGGRLFHTPEPQTEKARLPNWVRVLCIAAALVVAERSCRRESVELNATRSAKYAGQRRRRHMASVFVGDSHASNSKGRGPSTPKYLGPHRVDQGSSQIFCDTNADARSICGSKPSSLLYAKLVLFFINIFPRCLDRYFISINLGYHLINFRAFRRASLVVPTCINTAKNKCFFFFFYILQCCVFAALLYCCAQLLAN